MRLVHRTLALLVVCGLSLFAAGCGGNKDKLVGKWKIDSVSGKDSEGFKFFEAMKIFIVLEFGKDGTIKMSVDSNDPKMKEEMAKSKDKSDALPSGKYTVSGDTLEITDMADKGGKGGPLGKKGDKTKIKFDGNDKLTLSGSDSSMNLSRMK